MSHSRPGSPFHVEELHASARVEIHKSHGEMVGFVFHVGDFSVPLVRCRPFQRVGERLEAHPQRPWVMGRVTHRELPLLENPGVPGIALRPVTACAAEVRAHGWEGDGSAGTVWIDGEARTFDAFFPGDDHRYCYDEVSVSRAPVLAQTCHSEGYSLTREIALTEKGPVQRTTVEATGRAPVDLLCHFISMLPEGCVRLWGGGQEGEQSVEGSMVRPHGSDTTAAVEIPATRWLVAYDPARQRGTALYSPEFAADEMSHLLVMDPRQGFRTYHVAGAPDRLARGPSGTEGIRLRVPPGSRREVVLWARQLEASPDDWVRAASRAFECQ